MNSRNYSMLYYL